MNVRRLAGDAIAQQVPDGLLGCTGVQQS